MDGPGAPLVFVGQIQQISPEFWSEGVDSSKGILETILKKINNAGSQLNYLLKEHSSLIIRNRFQAIEEGEIWLDKEEIPRMSLSIKEESYCALVDTLKVPLPDLSYTCTEAEQLYGVGYHKVYETCKTEPFFEKMKVDWPFCFQTHYPWVDIMNTSICVIKSYLNDFLACFCSLENGKVVKRGFCLTKLECAVTSKQKTEKPKKHALISTDCFIQIHHFLGGKTMERVEFENAQMQENLRVRPPYHEESVCYEQHFESIFDIGQLDVENMEAGVMVYTPMLMETQDINEDENEIIFSDIIEEENEILDENLEYAVKIAALKIVLVKRTLLQISLLIVGIVFIIWIKVKDNADTFVTITIQLVILTLGIVNLLVSIIPEQLDIQEVLLVPVVVHLLLNNRRNSNFILKLSLLSIFLEIMIWILLNKRFDNILAISDVYFSAIGLYTLYRLSITHGTEVDKETYHDVSKTKVGKNQKKNAPVNTKKKEVKSTSVRSGSKKNKMEKQQAKQTLDDPNVVKISCFMNCFSTHNVGYVCVNCNKNCFIEFHNKCWKEFLTQQGIEGQNCPEENCNGIIKDIVSVDRFGKELEKQNKLLKRIKNDNNSCVKTDNNLAVKDPKENTKKKHTDIEKPDKKCLNNIKSKESLTQKEDKISAIKMGTMSCNHTLPKEPKNKEMMKTTNQGSLKYQSISTEVVDNPTVKEDPKKTRTETVTYMPGKQKKDLINAVKGKDGKEIKNAKEAKVFSPLTRILHKDIAGYTIEALDEAVMDILNETDSANLTIPDFKEILMKKLENELWPDGIYISDEEE